jgi:CubicO group peptidase (beta-lactamase class C family)
MSLFPTPPVCLLVVFLLVSDTGTAQSKKETPYFPPAGKWEKKDPGLLGFDTTRLRLAIDFARASESKTPRDLKEAHYQSAFGREPFGFPVGPLKERGPATGLIIRNGYIVAEWGEPDRIDLTFSVAKSFLSTVAGLARDSGLIPDINQKLHTVMPPVIPFGQHSGGENIADEQDRKEVIELFTGEHNRKISWDHLLRQTSDWEGSLWGKPDWADRPSGDAATWKTRPRNEPGKVYEYNDTRVNLLALCLLNVWHRPLPQILKEKIMDPIGASSGWRWTGYRNSWIELDGQVMQSVSGGSHWGGGMFISAYDQARFGYLTLHNGNWNGRQLISEAWINLSKTPTQAQPDYGFMNYFLNLDRKRFPAAPALAFAHIGAGTNLIFVDREHNLVIVARWIENDAVAGLVEKVLGAIRK